jgi:hypothetical protein
MRIELHTWSRRFVAFALAGVALTPVVGAHSISKADVLARLNHDAVRSKLGIDAAELDPVLKRHLIIHVTEKWYELSESSRKQMAGRWLSLWRHATRRGIVSVVDAESGAAVVNFGPSGQVTSVQNAGDGPTDAEP